MNQRNISLPALRPAPQQAEMMPASAHTHTHTALGRLRVASFSLMSAVENHWDISRSTAISNCSNSGLNLLTAWYDGMNIVYKESPNSMVFKTSPTVVHTPAGGSGFQAWPNPATDVLHLKGPEAGHYSLTDMAGKVLLQGSCKAEAMVSLRGLANGLYLLSYKDAQGKTENLKIVKQ